LKGAAGEQRFIAALIAPMPLASCGLGDWGEDPLTEKHPDPRAVPGSESEIPLEKALGDLGITMPPDAKGVRFKSRNDFAPYYLYVKFTVPCSRAESVIQANRLIDLHRSDMPGSLDEYTLENISRTVEAQIPSGAGIKFFVSKYSSNAHKKGGLLFSPDKSNCTFVLAAERYI